MTVENDSGAIALELVEGGQRFRCQFDVATGQAILNIVGQPADRFQPSATTTVKGPGTYHVLFANVDEQLLLWVDDDLVTFNGPTTYNGREPNAPRVDNEMPNRADLAPIGIASEGATLKVSGLRVLRDIYYIAARSSGHAPTMNDYQRSIESFGFFPREMRRRGIAN